MCSFWFYQLCKVKTMYKTYRTTLYQLYQPFYKCQLCIHCKQRNICSLNESWILIFYINNDNTLEHSILFCPIFSYLS